MTIDLVAIGRANLDLYSQSIGSPFAEISGFDAMVGGSPTNIAIGVSRLGLTSAILTAVGNDRTGDFVLRYLQDEGVGTEYIPRIEGKLTSLALIGVEPPDHFPLSFYREDPADIHLRSEHVDAVDFSDVRSIEVSGNALARGSCVDAVFRVVEEAREHEIPVYVDVDLRPSEWDDPADFGLAIGGILPYTDVLIGTEDEYRAAFLPGGRADAGPVAGAEDRAMLDDVVASATASGPGVVITKRGPDGATVRSPAGELDVAGFPVEVVNTVGAGDAFAAGLIRSRLVGLDWADAVRFANACGAIVVTRHGCSVALPTEPEVQDFLARQEGRTDPSVATSAP